MTAFPRPTVLVRSGILVAILAFFAACGGGGGNGEAPAAPVAASIPAGGGGNNINAMNVGLVFVEVLLDLDSPDFTSIEVTIQEASTSFGDPGVPSVSASITPVVRAEVITVGPLDATALPDGLLSVWVQVIGPGGASERVLLLNVTKDTSVPNVSAVLHVAPNPGESGPGIPKEHVVNSTNVGDVSVEVEFFGIDDADSASVVLTDGEHFVRSNEFTPIASGVVHVGGLDAGALFEGPLELTLSVLDTVGNVTVVDGVPAFKDVTIAAATGARIIAGPANAADVVNGSTASDASVDVDVAPEAEDTDVVSVRVEGGAARVESTAQPAPQGGGTISITGLDLSSLPDGPLSVTAVVTDVSGNVVETAGTPADKDVAIGQATALAVAASMLNAAGEVSAASAPQVMLDVTLDAATAPGDLVTVTLDDGTASVQTALVAAGPGAAQLGPVDVTALADGPINLAAVITDDAGNASSPFGATASKDATPPSTPAAAAVPAGPQNAMNVIAAGNASSVTVTATAGAGNDPSRTLTVRITDGATSLEQTASAPTGGASIAFNGFDASVFGDGALTLEAWTADGFGNSSTMLSTPISKDTLVAVPTAATIPAGAFNSQDFVAASNASAVTVSVTLPGQSLASDVVSLQIGDGSASALGTPQAAPAGGGQITFTGIDASMLADGMISVAGTVTDVSGNTAPFGPFAMTKDTAAPIAPSVLAVSGSGANPPSVINSLTAASVSLSVTYDPSMDGTESVTATLTAGSAVTSPATAPPNGGGASVINGLVATSLSEGAVAVSMTLTDVAGNVTTATGTAALKDTVAPAAPTAAVVAAGSSNAQGVINANNDAAVMVDVTFAASSASTDQVRIDLFDTASGSASSSPATAPAGAGTVTVGPLDAMALQDGTVTLDVVLTDENFNEATFSGSAASKDTSGPAAITSAGVAGGPSNAPDVINAASVAAVSVDVVFPASYAGTETATVRLSDGVTTLSAAAVTAPAGGGAVTTSPLDVSALNDGVLTLTVDVTDDIGNTATFTGSAPLMDTMAPDAPTAAGVASGPDNAADFINNQTESAVAVAVVVPATYTGGETVSVSLDDGVAPPVMGAPQAAPMGGGTMTFSGLDASSLADGPVTVTVDFVDAAGNASSFAGAPATKDVIGPPGPTLLTITAVGGVNPADTINMNIESSVPVDVGLDGAMVGNETVFVSLTDGSSTVNSSTVLSPPGGGLGTFLGLDGSGLNDGPVTLTMTLTDPDGNRTISAPVAITKDATPPAAPLASHVRNSGSNPIDVIAPSNLAAVDVDVDFDAASVSSDTVTVVLDDGVNPTVTVGAGAASVGMGTLTFGSGDATSLADGSITVEVTLQDSNLNAATYTGTPATKDTTPPADPSFARVAAGANNPVNFINNQSESAVAVEVSIPGSYAGTETVSVSLGDGANPAVTSGTQTAPAGGGLMTFTGLDASSLNTGSISVSVSFQDVVGNSSSFTGTSATKDVTGPPGPTLLTITAVGGVNPANTVNMNIENSVAVDVGLDGAMVGNETVFVSLTDGSSTVNSSTVLSPPGGGLGTFLGLNCSGLNDGPVTLTMTLTDPAGNQTISSPVAVTKDSTPPAAPASAHVRNSGANPIDFITPANEASVEVDVAFGAGSVATDTATVTVSDGANPAVSIGSGAANAGAGTKTFGTGDASGLNEGPISVQVVLQDANLNSATYAGTAATKDTTPPADPSFARIASGANNPVNFINNQSESAVAVEVSIPGSYAGTETVSVGISDGANPAVTSGSQTAPAGGGLMTFTGLNASSLNDGPISVSVAFQDAGGNSSTFAGTGGTKDVTGPPGPTLLTITAVGGVNPSDTVNANIQNSVPVDVGLDGAMVGNETVFVSLTDGSSTVNSSTVLSPPGGGLGTFLGLNCSGLNEGPLTLTMTLTDPAGNQTISSPVAVTKDATPPPTPTSATIVAGGGNNQDWISAASVNAVAVDVVVPSGYDASDVLTLTLRTGGTTVTDTQTPPMGGGTVSFTGLMAASLSDGSVSVEASVMDTNLNSATLNASGDKDVAVPVVPTAAVVAMSAMNPQDYINSLTVASCVVDVTWGAGVDANDRVTVDLGDGMITAGSAAVTAPGSPGTVSSAPFDASSLSDGAITLTLNVFDLAGNTASGMGTAATKDVVAPNAPVVDPVTTPTNDAAQVVTGTAEGDAAIDVSGGAAPAAGTAASGGTFSVSVTLTADAMNALSVTATDVAGNTGSAATTDFNAAALTIVHSSTAPDLPFTDVTVSAGVGHTGAAAGGSFADLDGDGDLDILLGGAGRVFLGDGAGVFSDVTGSLGVVLTADGSTTHADYDNDGDLDLFLTDSAAGGRLIRNDLVGMGSFGFTDVTGSAGAGIGMALRAGGWFDYDGDGHVDFVAADNDGSGNELLHNLGAGTFGNVTSSGLSPMITTDPNWTAFGDLDGDGDLDVVIGDSSPSQMYLGDGAGSFTDVAGAMNSGFDATMESTGGGLALADVDNDGDLDVFVCRGDATNANQLWMNDGAATFTESAVAAGIDGDVGAYDVVTGDFDHDGRIDLYLCCSGGANVLLLNQGDQVGGDGIPEFVDVAAQTGCEVDDAGDGRVALAGDIDGDGDLEIYVGNHMTANVLFRNELDNYNYLVVRVAGKGGGAGGASVDAIGAVVTLTDEVTMTDVMWRTISGGRGAGAQDPGAVHFGGVTPSRPYTVTVTLPTGTMLQSTGVVPAMLASQTLTIVEP